MRGMMAQFLWAWGPFDMVKHRHGRRIIAKLQPGTTTRQTRDAVVFELTTERIWRGQRRKHGIQQLQLVAP